MQKQLHCQSILLIHDLCLIYFRKGSEVTVTGNANIQAHLYGVIEDISPTNAILGRIISHQLEIHLKQWFAFL